MQTIEKTRYIPTGFAEYKPEIGDYKKDLFACYVKIEGGKFYAIFYKGKSTKHLFYNRFATEADMQKKINGTISRLMAWEDQKLERKQKRKEPHTLKMGDILYSSWGYDQTNINFYQITREVGTNTVELREIASKTISDNGPTTYVSAVKDAFLLPRSEWDKTGETLTRRVSDGRIKISEVQSAYIWDGKPKYETGFGFGH